MDRFGGTACFLFALINRVEGTSFPGLELLIEQGMDGIWIQRRPEGGSNFEDSTSSSPLDWLGQWTLVYTVS
jgi:hypothetical protein